MRVGVGRPTTRQARRSSSPHTAICKLQSDVQTLLKLNYTMQSEKKKSIHKKLNETSRRSQSATSFMRGSSHVLTVLSEKDAMAAGASCTGRCVTRLPGGPSPTLVAATTLNPKAVSLVRPPTRYWRSVPDTTHDRPSPLSAPTLLLSQDDPRLRTGPLAIHVLPMSVSCTTKRKAITIHRQCGKTNIKEVTGTLATDKNISNEKLCLFTKW